MFKDTSLYYRKVASKKQWNLLGRACPFLQFVAEFALVLVKMRVQEKTSTSLWAFAI